MSIGSAKGKIMAIVVVVHKTLRGSRCGSSGPLVCGANGDENEDESDGKQLFRRVVGWAWRRWMMWCFAVYGFG